MIKVNAIGDVCPIPVVKTKKAMQDKLKSAGLPVQYQKINDSEILSKILAIVTE